MLHVFIFGPILGHILPLRLSIIRTTLRISALQNLYSMEAKAHWENIYQTKPTDSVSWYAPHLDWSFTTIKEMCANKGDAILDIGGGASTLPDDLLKDGFSNIHVLDISQAALDVSIKRLQTLHESSAVKFTCADITKAALEKSYYSIWHDRTVFHFFREKSGRELYVQQLKSCLKSGGYVLMSIFGPDGPLKCSGIEIVRYDTEKLSTELGEDFELIKSEIIYHHTPFNTDQQLLCCVFKKK